MAVHIRATKNFEIFPKDSTPANCESHSSLACPERLIVYTVYPHFYIPLYLKTVKQGITLPRRVKILFCLNFYFSVGNLGSGGTTVAQWLRCCATNQKVAGSIPDGVIIFH